MFRRTFLLSVVIFIVALLPRLAAIERYITPDELIWVYRSVNFREALRAGMWADTLLAGHPGVITMWLGALSMSVQLLLSPADQEIYQWITQLAWLTPDNMTAFRQLSAFLTYGRLSVALLNSLGIVLVFWMARRLLDDTFAVLVTAFLVLDPFLAGLSGLLHVDGLMTTFVTISLLSLALSFKAGEDEGQKTARWLYVALSGSSAALAVLAKSPALLLIPFAAAIFFLGIWKNRREPLLKRLRNILPLGVVWLGSFLLILFLVFPALWNSPLQVLQTTFSNANRHVEEALRPTFFLGTVAFDHGLLFYPISLAWRLGPVVMVGLIILLILPFQSDRRNKFPKFSMLILFLWIVIFLAGITMAAKKFDRYILPIIPAVTLLAAIGWAVWLRSANRIKQIFLAMLLILQVVYMLFVLPYPLAAYNLLLGGPYSAKYVMPIGWGESISGAGGWLAGEPDVGIKKAVSGIAPSLAPFFPGETLLADAYSYEAADYVILTANSRQVDPQGFEQAARDLILLKVIRYGGLDQSWIYANPRPNHEELTLRDLPQPVTFGSQMQLLSQDLTRWEEEIRFTARWDRQQSEDQFLVKLKLLDTNGHIWSQLETALLNEVYFFPEHWQPDETPIVTYRLELPPAIPPGAYKIELSLVDQATDSQLPVLAEGGTFQGVHYDAGDLMLTLPALPPDTENLDMIAVGDVTWEEDSLRLLGHAKLPERVVAGGELNLNLYWQAVNPLVEGLQVSIQIADEIPVVLPLSRYDSGLWQSGTIIQEKYRLQIPPDMSVGDVLLSVKPLFADDSEMNGSRHALGDVEIHGTDRLYTLPKDIPIPLYAVFEPGITLRGVKPGDVTITSGDVLDLVLIWQTEDKTEEPVTAFVHLVDDQGNIMAQLDRWPGGLPSNIWAQGQVIVDEYELELAPDIKPGTYQIVVGLYTAENGRRLPVSDADGRPYPDKSVHLPLTVTVRR
jgi:hypothetical protein